MQLKEVISRNDYITKKKVTLCLRRRWKGEKIYTDSIIFPEGCIVTLSNVRGEICRVVEFLLTVKGNDKSTLYSYPIGLFAHYFSPYQE